MNLRLAPLFAAATLLSMPLASHALVYQFNAALNSSNEVVTLSNDPGTGVATLFYNDMGTAGVGDDTYDFSLSVFNLSSVATAAHIHAPATTAANAPPVVNLLANPPFASFTFGGILLVGGSGVTPPPSFLSNLQAGLAYVNVHNAIHPTGAIRGQLMQVAVVPEPATYGMMALGLLGVGLVARRRRNA